MPRIPLILIATLLLTALARQYLLHAKALLTDSTGIYHLHEVYCEMLDTIYLSDVEAALRD